LPFHALLTAGRQIVGTSSAVVKQVRYILPFLKPKHGQLAASGSSVPFQQQADTQQNKENSDTV
jgi:hypothetical protein